MGSDKGVALSTVSRRARGWRNLAHRRVHGRRILPGAFGAERLLFGLYFSEVLVYKQLLGGCDIKRLSIL